MESEKREKAYGKANKHASETENEHADDREFTAVTKIRMVTAASEASGGHSTDQNGGAGHVQGHGKPQHGTTKRISTCEGEPMGEADGEGLATSDGNIVSGSA